MYKVIGIFFVIIVIVIAGLFIGKQAGETQMKSERETSLQGTDATSALTLLGVVDPPGVAGSQSQGSEQWALSFAFTVWRPEGEPIREAKLRMHCPVTLDELEQYMGQIKPYMILRVNAQFNEETDSKVPQATLLEIVSTDEDDTELIEWAGRLQEPVTFDHERFGTFSLDRRVDNYKTKTEWLGNEIILCLSAKDDDEVQKALEAATILWQSQKEWNERIRKFAAKELLALKNENWLEEGELEVTSKQFQDRMELESITLYPDASFEFWHNDGDLFFGHSILISGSISDGPTDADIPG